VDPIDPADTVEVRGVRLRSGPAREPCFVVAQVHTEMRASVDMSATSQRDMLHRECNQEVLSVEIAAQTLVDFPEAAWELRLEIARQCWDETRHARLRFQRLLELGGHKGEFPIINQEWAVVCMLDSLPARLAVQNRTFEAGSLDGLQMAVDSWRRIGDERTAEMTEAILCDEIQHVRFANDWLKRMTAADPRVLLTVAKAMKYVESIVEKLSPRSEDRSVEGVDLSKVNRDVRTNAADRRSAGFADAEIDEVARKGAPGMGS
jgi:uncharacterized ferritin-like protein (DUF455 family)